MTDSELVENMSQDAERYIPFPPSEVIMDFKALRELPTDPDAPNMEVLLAAAQSEVVDAHINVLGSAKLDSRAVDVEPLAVARSVADLNASLSDEGYIDYYDVSAIINLGATATEISVLRGDLLVFTRSVPKGGNDFTQSLIDHLALPWHDAERLKLEMADALPPQTTTVAGSSSDDWSDFGVFDEQAPDGQGGQNFGQATDFDNFDTAFEAFDDVSATAPTVHGSTPPANAPRTSDPFDPDFYQQGPQNREPGEQHGQKENEPFNFDFADFAATGSDEKAGETSAAAPAATPAADAATPDAAFNFSFDDATPAPPVVTPPTVTPASVPPSLVDDEPIAAPSQANQASPVIPTEASTGAAQAAGGVFSFDSPEEAASWTGTNPASPSPATPPAPKLDLPDFDTLVAESQAEQADGVQSATIDSAYDLSEFADIQAPGKTTAPAPATSVTPAAEDDDFDLDALFGADAPTEATSDDFSAFDVGAASAAPAAAVGAGAMGGASAPSAASDDFGFGMGGFENFGAGLAGAGDTPMIGIDAATVYSILAPQLEELIAEVRRSLEYHASRYPDAAVRRIVLVGGGARMKNLDAYFTQELGIPVSIGNPLARLPVKSSQLQPDYIAINGPTLSVALGLALRDMI
jgi:Tfp pilus assembly PilM family ATPase